MDSDPPFVEMPSLRWPQSGWWFTVIGTLVGAFLLVVPSATQLSLTNRVLVGTGIACIPAAIILLFHFIRCAKAFCRRALAHGALHESIAFLREDIGKATAAVNTLVREREEARALRLDHCYYYESTAVVVLQRKRGFKVVQGARLLVIDRENGRPLGTIEITDASGDRYIAKALEDIDPLWLGYIRQAGSATSAPPPDAIALHITDNGESNA